MSGSSVLFDAPGPRARRLSLILSIVAGLLILGAAVWVIMTLAAPRTSGGINLPGMFDPSRWDIFADPAVWGFIAEGIVATLQAAAVAAVGAIILGIALSLLRSSLIPWVRIPTAWVIEFFRGMPVLLMMLFILLVASTGAFWAVVIALILYNGTLIGEILRAGLVALPRGQREAALSVGMREFQSKMLVEFPQAFRQMLPIIIAQLVVLLRTPRSATSWATTRSSAPTSTISAATTATATSSRSSWSPWRSTWRSTSRCRGSPGGSRAAPPAAARAGARVVR
jgi:glutamate transport system permease protein